MIDQQAAFQFPERYDLQYPQEFSPCEQNEHLSYSEFLHLQVSWPRPYLLFDLTLAPNESRKNGARWARSQPVATTFRIAAECDQRTLAEI